MTSARPPGDSRRPHRTSGDLRSAYRETVHSLAPVPPARKRPWVTRGMMRLALAVAVALAIVLAVSLWGVYQASQQVPQFYEQALAAPPETQVAAGQALERQAASLNNQVRRPGRW